MMNSEKANMTFAALLIALLVWLVAAIISETLVDPAELQKSVYKIDVPEGGDQGQAASAQDEAEPISDLMASADLEKGKNLTKQCVQCHSLNEGGPNKIGPNLWGIVGAAIAAKDGFAYSAAAKAMADQKWTIEDLNKFLYKPRKYMKGTKMAYAGLKKASDRANLIAYLKTLS